MSEQSPAVQIGAAVANRAIQYANEWAQAFIQAAAEGMTPLPPRPTDV